MCKTRAHYPDLIDDVRDKPSEKNDITELDCSNRHGKRERFRDSFVSNSHRSQYSSFSNHDEEATENYGLSPISSRSFTNMAEEPVITGVRIPNFFQSLIQIIIYVLFLFTGRDAVSLMLMFRKGLRRHQKFAAL